MRTKIEEIRLRRSLEQNRYEIRLTQGIITCIALGAFLVGMLVGRVI